MSYKKTSTEPATTPGLASLAIKGKSGPSRQSSTSSQVTTMSNDSTSPVSSSPTSPNTPARSMSMSWDDVLLHACSQPCGGTVLGSNVKGPCKPIGRTDGVIICWWCSRWLGTFEIWAPPIPPPLHANVYESDDNSVDNFYR